MGYVAVLQRMPTKSELPGDLGSAIAVYGGFEHWAKRLDLKSKGSETLLGRGIEAVVANDLRTRGHTVERQTVKAPFDLLVNGVTRIDVKAANYGEWPHKDNSMVRGYVFAGLKRGRDCDMFILACLKDGTPFTYFVVPAASARVTVVTITPKSLTGKAKRAQYRDRFDLIPGPNVNAASDRRQ